MRTDTLHIYAQSAALTIESVQTEDRRGHTIRLEAARRKPDSKNYRWDEKLTIQVTQREFPDVMACLLGYRDQVEFQYHGIRNNKGYRMVSDKNILLIELFSQDQGKIRVPTEPTDRFALTTYALRTFQRNYGGISSESLLKIVANCYQ